MKTQQKTTKKNKPNDAKKQHNRKVAIYTAVLCTALIMITLAIVLPLTLGGPVDDGPYIPVVVTPTPEPPPPEQMLLPMAMDEFEVGKLPALNRLVFHQTLNNWRTHNGLNLNAPIGTQVRTIASGTVLSVEHTQLEASIVTIQHANGKVSSYHGLATDVRVEEGDRIPSGTILGTIAPVRPIARSEGSHLHLRVRQNGNLIDPLTLFPELADYK
ncbi:MAG: M23 family metallopeptidase [Firmicutes bacterium]|nr:M23 family metallopeptidase [Bacillota bacterium]